MGRAWPTNDLQSCSVPDNHKVLKLELERNKLAMSTATSLASLLGKDSD